MNKTFFLVLLSTLAACGGGNSTGGNTITPDNPKGSKEDVEEGSVTDFTLTDVDGKSVALGDYLGKKAILLDFWATWCKPCIAEMGHLQKMYEAKKDGFVVLAISMDASETEAQVAPTVKTKGWTFPVLLDSETRATSLYNPRRSAPYTVLINKQGKVVKKREGYNPGDEAEIEKDIDAAMK
jgi:peroxiredoxin